MDKSDIERVAQGARELLLRNRRTLRKKGVDYHFTCPDAVMYMGQWLWDSCFHIMALRWFDPEHAEREFASLLSGQWPDGRIPNMVHLRPLYRRFEHFTPYDTSGITQPPLVADAAYALYEITKDKSFLEKYFEPLCRYYDWLDRERDPDRDGLISVYHPWETGIDNSPRWDTIFGVDPKNFKRWKFNFPKARLIMTFNYISGYKSEKMRAASLFDVESADMNSYYFRNMNTLARIADTLGRGDAAAKYRGRAAATRAAMIEKMWNEKCGAFFDLEGKNERPLEVLTPFALMPLYAGMVEDDRAARLITHLEDPAAFATPFPVPTVAVSHPAFDPVQYWRGTAWVNSNWLMVQGLLQYGREDLARRIAASTVEMTAKYGFREYYNPITGEGHGAGHFSWSSLVLDFIHSGLV